MPSLGVNRGQFERYINVITRRRKNETNIHRDTKCANSRAHNSYVALPPGGNYADKYMPVLITGHFPPKAYIAHKSGISHPYQRRKSDPTFVLSADSAYTGVPTPKHEQGAGERQTTGHQRHHQYMLQCYRSPPLENRSVKNTWAYPAFAVRPRIRRLVFGPGGADHSCNAMYSKQSPDRQASAGVGSVELVRMPRKH
nr:hypothetical protein CFP56_12117 [Quercus suber]